MSNGRRSLSPGALFPSLSSTPLESNSSAHLTNGVIDNQQLSNLKKDSLLSGTHSCQSQDGDIGNIGSRSGENTPGDSDSSTPLEQLIELGASGQRREEPNTLSDLSDEEGELSVHVHVPEDSADTCDRSPSPLDLSQRMIPVPSPDSLYLQEAKKNLKQAEELGYSGSSHPDSRSSRDDYSSQSDNRTTAQSRDDLSPTLDPALTNERRNTLSLPLSSLEKPSQIPRLIPSQHSPRPRYRRPHSSHYPRQQAQYSSNATMTTTPANVGVGASMSKDQSGVTWPGEGDSGFAGSEFPSRTATRMDASIPTRSLASSMLQSTTSEDDANQQRFLEAR